MKGKIVYPYEPYLNKNSMHPLGDAKLGYVSRAKKAMDGISFLIRPPFYGYRWNNNRIKVTITVYRPQENIDPHNFETSICDAIKVGIGVDDCEFDVSCIGKVDKENPRIVIEVEQDV